MSGTLGTLIVTGAARGIGAACALLAASRGYAVAVNYGSDEAGAAEITRKISEAGGKAASIQGNVAKEADVIRLFETAERLLGPVTGLINNAGISGKISRLEAME